MAASNQITSAMQQYVGEKSGELFMLAYQSMDIINDVTFYPDVKNKLILTSFEIDDIVKPFSTTVSATNDVFRFIPRELNVDVAKAELRLQPELYRQTYLAEFMKPGVAIKPEDMPFEQYIWEAFFKKFGEQLNNTTAYFGVKNASGTTAVDVTDGLGTILAALITATTIVPNTLGAVNSTNALSKFKTLARLVPAKYRTPAWGWTLYLSIASYEAYTDNLDTLLINTGRGDAIGNKKWLRGYEGIMELKPVTWMGASARLILTPKANIIMGGDALEGDLQKVNIIPELWGSLIGMAAALGFQFRIPGLVYCNELT